MTRTGRPKTGAGHRDDAMLDMIDFRGLLAELVEMRQRHYREERDALVALDALVRDATLSWRYGEIQDGLTAERAA